MEGITSVYFVFIRDGIWAYFLLFGLFIASVTFNKLVDVSVPFWATNFTAITIRHYPALYIIMI